MGKKPEKDYHNRSDPHHDNPLEIDGDPGYLNAPLDEWGKSIGHPFEPPPA